MPVESFRISASDQALEDLRYRLDHTRWPTAGPGDDDWADGVSLDYLRGLVEYWRDNFDWRRQEAVLNRYPQVQVDVNGIRIHAVHVRGRGKRPLPLLLTHGWPSSFVEFLGLVDRLTDPGRHGGDPDDSFSVVVPSLPGFAFSDPLPPQRADSPAATWVELMDALGYPTFGAHGGDIGGFVTNQLALDHPDRLVGIHTTYPAEPPSDPSGIVSSEERRFLDARDLGRELGGGYAHIQRTRPQTLTYGLNDSPVGLAAWILDKWWDWSDHRGSFEHRFNRDLLLTTITLYWLTGSIGPSFRLYRAWGLGGAPVELLAQHYPYALPGVEPAPLPPGRRIEVPTGIAIFAIPYPRSFVERAYSDLRHWTVMPRGGHFPAVEEPDLLAADLREFFRPLR